MRALTTLSRPPYNQGKSQTYLAKGQFSAKAAMKTIVTLLVGVLIVDDGPKPDPVKKELDKFQGTWEFVAVEFDGKDLMNIFKDAKAVVEADKVKLIFPSGTVLARRFKLGLTTNPKCVDFFGLDKKGKPDGNNTEGIYEWKEDNLRLCVSIKDGVKERPLEFTAKPGTGCILYVAKRKPMDK